MARARNAVQTITVRAGKKVITPKSPKPGERLQFSGPGQFRIELTDEWPFTKPHSSYGSRFDQRLRSPCYKAARRWKSRTLTLVKGAEAEFDCYTLNPKGVPMKKKYGGEIKPR